MEILWDAKAPRADIYSQFVSALRTTAGCVKRRSRRAGPMRPAAKYALLPAGHAGPALQGAAIAGGCGHPPLRTLSLRGAKRRGNPFPARQRRADGTSGTPSPTGGVACGRAHPTPPQNTTNPELFCRKSPRFVTLSLIIRLLSCNFSLPVVDWFRIAV